jgi:hypothetical protein
MSGRAVSELCLCEMPKEAAELEGIKDLSKSPKAIKLRKKRVLKNIRKKKALDEIEKEILKQVPGSIVVGSFKQSLQKLPIAKTFLSLCKEKNVARSLQKHIKHGGGHHFFENQYSTSSYALHDSDVKFRESKYVKAVSTKSFNPPIWCFKRPGIDKVDFKGLNFRKSES